MINKQQRVVAVDKFERGRDSIRSSMYGGSFSEPSLQPYSTANSSVNTNTNNFAKKPMSPVQEAINRVQNDFKDDMGGIFDDLDSDEDENIDGIGGGVVGSTSINNSKTSPGAVGAEDRLKDARSKQINREFSRKEVKNCMLDLLSSKADSRLHREMDEGVKRPASANGGGIVRRSVNPPGDHPYVQRSHRYNDMVTTGVFLDHRRKGWGLDWSHDMKRTTVDSHAPVSDWKKAALQRT